MPLKSNYQQPNKPRVALALGAAIPRIVAAQAEAKGWVGGAQVRHGTLALRAGWKLEMHFCKLPMDLHVSM